jgi:hypothetical protein
VDTSATKSLDDSKSPNSEQCSTSIDDRRFFAALKLLRIIQETIVSHKATISDENQKNIHLGSLQTIRLAPIFIRFLPRFLKRHFCRPPSGNEWSDVEDKIIKLMYCLDEEQIKMVEIKHLSGVMLDRVALWLLVFSIISLTASLALNKWYPVEPRPDWYFPAFLLCFTCWLATMGSLGSAAFIYVNALSIQVDPRVDVTSRTLVIMRLILGALFSVILALPFGNQTFIKFSNELFKNNMEMAESFLLLLPFILGFSTPLVLNILGRFIRSAQTFFGMTGSSGASAAEPRATTSQPTPGAISR